MNTPLDVTYLEARLAPVAQEQGMVLEKVVVTRQGDTPLIRVVVDLDHGTAPLGADALAQVSRAISATMDDVDPVAGEYLLEVSTPGATRELTEPRHWRRAVGRPVAVRTRDGADIRGVVSEVLTDAVVVATDGGATTIPLDNVKKARPRVEFDSEG